MVKVHLFPGLRQLLLSAVVANIFMRAAFEVKALVTSTTYHLNLKTKCCFLM